jgi:hypothetical protein
VAMLTFLCQLQSENSHLVNLFFFFGGTGVWTQDLELARQPLYPWAYLQPVILSTSYINNLYPDEARVYLEIIFV